MSKQDIILNLKSIKFYKEILPLLNILEKNLDRVEFVKDGLYLENFVFIAEQGAIEFEDNPFYGCFNVDVVEDNDEMSYLSMKRSMIDDLKQICKNVEKKIKEEDKKIYVWIAFKESTLSQTDMFIVMEKLKSKSEKSPFEAKAKLRKYPKWFTAQMPLEILAEEKQVNALKECQNELNETNKKEILEQINNSIKNNDKELFAVLCSKYNKIYK